MPTTKKETPSPEKEGTKKDALPNGWLTPSGFAKVLSEQEGEMIRPQRIYGYVKNGRDFPHKKHSDGRVILDSQKAIAWFEALKVRKAAAAEAKKA